MPDAPHSPLRSFLPTCIVLLLLLTACLSNASAQGPSDEKPENLKVLPKDISRDELRAVMSGFTRALGVRCHHCHKGEAGQPLSTYDFASDEKETKKTARVMMRMVKAINGEYLAKLPEDEHGPRLQVTCVTCHHGLSHPQPLEDALADYLPAHGVDSTLAHYEALRAQYYGGFSYDFTEASLNRLAEQLIHDQKAAEALPFLERNAEMYPEAVQTYMLMGDAYLQLGDKDAAVERLEKAVALDPDNRRLQERLEEIRNQ